MSVISAITFIPDVAILAAAYFLWRGWKRALTREARILLAVLFSLILVVSVFRTLEWCLQMAVFDRIGDFIHILEPVLWLSFFYTFLHELARADFQAEETRLRRVLEALPVGVWITDDTGRIVESNPKGREIWGEAKYVGVPEYGEYKGWRRDTGRRIRPQEWAGVRVVKTGEVIINEEVEIENFEGERKVILNSAIPLRNAQNRVQGAIIVNEDITDLKRAEEAMEQRLIALTRPLGDLSTVKFEDLFDLDMIQSIQDAFAEATGVASAITDTAGRLITRPSNFCRLCAEVIRKTEKGSVNCHQSDAALGRMNPEGPILQPCLSAGLWSGGTSICVGDRHIANWVVGQVLDEHADLDKIRSYAHQIGADPAQFNEALAEVPRMPEGQFRKVCQALFLIARQLSLLALQNVQQGRDILRLKEAQEENRRLNKELEDRVRRRTADLEAMNRELEAFSYSVSHDLRTPLRAITGFSQILVEGYGDRLDDSGQELLNRVIQASRRMGELIEGLLTLARLTRMDLNRRKVDLSQLVETLTGDLHLRDPGRRVELNIQGGVIAEGDLILLRAVVENLVENAWKFTAGKNPTRIEFGVEMVEGKPAYFIRDNGAGFNMTYANKLFKAFSRLHHQDEFSGNGIGLATVQRIIQRHGGQVWARGEVNKGATFSFTLGS